jgi:hypothetical protein
MASAPLPKKYLSLIEYSADPVQRIQDILFDW